MDGKLFISLVCGAGGITLGVLQLAIPHNPWLGAVFMVAGAAWLARAFHYWRKSHA